MKKTVVITICSIVAIGCVILTIYNIQHNGNFFDTPIYAIINILIAVFIAYYLNQSKSDERKKKDFVSKIISKLERMASDRMCNIENEEDVLFVTIGQKEFQNKIDLLKKYSGGKEYNDMLEYIERELKEYWDLISNHISDIVHLKASRMDLQKHISNIRTKLEYLEWSLYD